MEPRNGEETPGTQAPCGCVGAPARGAASGNQGTSCCGDAPVQGAAQSGSGACCGCGTTTRRCSTGMVLVVLVILAGLGVAICSLVGPG